MTDFTECNGKNESDTEGLFDCWQSGGASREWCATNHRLRLMYGASSKKVQLRLRELTDMVYAWEQDVAKDGLLLDPVNRVHLRMLWRGWKSMTELTEADIYSMSMDELKLLALEKDRCDNATPYAIMAQKELVHRRGGAVAGHHRRNFKRLTDEP